MATVEVSFQSYDPTYWTTQQQWSINMERSLSKYQLHDAARLCDLRTIQILLSSGNVDVNSRDENGCTALYHVLSKGWLVNNGLEAVRSLCEQGADVNEKLDALDPTRPTYLTIAMCEYSHRNQLLNIMEILLSAGANPNVPNDTGRTPLYLACNYKRADVVDLLLFYGADVNLCDSMRSSPLHAAVKWCNPFDIKYCSLGQEHNVEFARAHSVVQRLLDCGAVVNLKDETGNIPLHLAISNHKRRYIDRQCTDIHVLLQNNSDIHTPSGFDGLNTLQLAAKNGKDAAVKFCLENGMSPNHYISHEHSPLNQAVKNNHPQVVNTLLDYGAQIGNPNEPFSVLHTAAFEGLPEMVDFLLSRGASPHEGKALHWVRDPGRVPLLVAGHVKIAKRLIANGATLRVNNAPGYFGRMDHGLTTLHFFLRSRSGHSECHTKLGTLFCNPQLQYTFCCDIFKHIVQENAIELTHNREISFNLNVKRMPQFIMTTCPLKLLILRLIGFRFLIFNNILRWGHPLLSRGKLAGDWKEVYSEIRKPLSLKSQCRIAIRRTISPPLSASVGKLPYPKCMQEYLLMSELNNL